MASGFYTVYALRAWQIAEWQVGVFTAFYLAGQMVGNLALGWLADRAGHRLVLVLGVASPLAGGLLADRLGFPAVFTVAALFCLAGAGLLLGRVREPRLARQRAT